MTDEYVCTNYLVAIKLKHFEVISDLSMLHSVEANLVQALILKENDSRNLIGWVNRTHSSS